MPQQAISFHYTLTNKTGDVIDTSRQREPMVFLEGAGQIIPGLEKALIAMKKGESGNVEVSCKEGYGPYDQKQIYRVPREKFPSDMKLKNGNLLRIGQENDHKTVIVIEIDDSQVVLDANHPLAGQDLFFAVEITDSREAATDEVAHGHAHGAGGHHH